MSKLSDYQSTGNAIGLAKLGAEKFTITGVKDSSYDGSPSLFITTKETFKIEGTEYSQFYTSRKAVMDTLKDEQLRASLADGKPLGPVKCQLTKAKGGGKDYWILVDV